MAIYHNEIGNLGHLGNQMFQYASLQGIAKNRGLDWKIPPPQHFGKNYSTLRSNIYECFYLDINIQDRQELFSGESILESKHGFDENLFNNCPDNVNLSGYFQSYKYFENIEKKIRRDFTFKNPNIGPIITKDTLSIHVRRTDYLGLSSYHTNLGLEYYQQALDEIGSFSNAIVFSDDIAWCQSLDIFKGFKFSSGSPYDDLYFMSKCDKHVIANSSFSWWGAWLSRSIDVIAPKKWFGPSLSDNNTEGYYLPGWRII